MYSKIVSSAINGIDGTVIGVEADVNDGLPAFTMVGYLSSSVKEAGERVRTALKNSGYHLPPKRITINLSPADIRKDGTGFDLAIAIAVLSSLQLVPKSGMEHTIILGELSLDGRVCPIYGVLAMIHYCAKKGFTRCIVPKENAAEAHIVHGMSVYGVGTLCEAVHFLNAGEGVLEYEDGLMSDDDVCRYEDFSDVHGQSMVKRGMEIAAAGFHNVLMKGSAGAGKSMLAKRLPSILPALTYEESVEVTKIYSISGLIKNDAALIRKRPFRSPHHTISSRALVGGGSIPRPGEISLAHKGILFLDEFPEFTKSSLEAMRQPLEDGCVTISRVNSTYRFPADVMLVGAMNLCPCGYFPDMKRCSCTHMQIKKYQDRISGPLMDRIDINMEIKPVPYAELFSKSRGESSAVIRARVCDAIEIQKKRYRDDDITFNSELTAAQIKKYVELGLKEQMLLEEVFETSNLSARGTFRILKLARTIADLDHADTVSSRHLEEAVFYRNNDTSFEEVFIHV